MKLSKNRKDYIFCIGKDPYSFEPDTKFLVAYITPSDFFYENGHMYDQHLPIKTPGWFEESEGVFSPDKQDTEENLKAELIALGLEWSEDFHNFMNGDKGKYIGELEDEALDAQFIELGRAALRTSAEIAPGIYQVTSSNSIFANTTKVFLSIGEKRCANIPSLPTGKIGTEECKKAITDLIKVNPGMVAKEFTGDGKQEETLALVEKNWARTSKRKESKLNVREFNCKPLDDQLRAIVMDNGREIVQIEIQGE